MPFLLPAPRGGVPKANALRAARAARFISRRPVAAAGVPDPVPAQPAPVRPAPAARAYARLAHAPPGRSRLHRPASAPVRRAPPAAPPPLARPFSTSRSATPVARRRLSAFAVLSAGGAARFSAPTRPPQNRTQG